MEQFYNNLELRDLTTTYKGIFYEEQWMPIQDFEDKYHISTFGRCKSKFRIVIDTMGRRKICKERILIQHIGNNYYHINLYDKKTIYCAKLHRLVGTHFIPNPENKPEVNHKYVEATKSYNVVWNLEWNTRKENDEHARKNNLIPPMQGEKHGRSKLTEKDVLEIRAIGNSMLHKDIAILYNTKRANIGLILARKTWKHI